MNTTTTTIVSATVYTHAYRLESNDPSRYYWCVSVTGDHSAFYTKHGYATLVNSNPQAPSIMPVSTVEPDWQDESFAYALIADPKHRIVSADDVMDNSVVILVGSYNQCDRELDRLIAAAYDRQVARFESAYDAHIEEMACGY